MSQASLGFNHNRRPRFGWGVGFAFRQTNLILGGLGKGLSIKITPLVGIYSIFTFTTPSLFTSQSGNSEKAQWVTANATKPDDLRASILRAHMVKGENLLP